MCRSSLVMLAMLVFAARAANATTYAPATFTDLVTRADVIFAGEVIDVQPFAVDTRDGTIIKTRVVFRVSDPLWGTTAALEVFEFLGGELNGSGMAVADMPTFAVGDRRVVFASRRRSINPIVGFRQGLLEIRRDSSGVDRIFTLDGLPLTQPENIGSAVRVSPQVEQPMRLADFRDRVLRALSLVRKP